MFIPKPGDIWEAKGRFFALQVYPNLQLLNVKKCKQIPGCKKCPEKILGYTPGGKLAFIVI